MNFEVTPFEPMDLEAFRGTSLTYGSAFEDWAQEIVVSHQRDGRVWTGRWNGAVAAVAGYAEPWPGRACIWIAILDDFPQSVNGAVALALTRLGRKLISGMPHRRIEATVLAGFDAGERWARMLGFEYEGTLRCYDPLGRDHQLFAIVRSEQWHPSSPSSASSDHSLPV